MLQPNLEPVVERYETNECTVCGNYFKVYDYKGDHELAFYIDEDEYGEAPLCSEECKNLFEQWNYEDYLN